MTYLGALSITNTAAAPAIVTRTSHAALFLGPVANGALTSGLTFSNSTAGLVSLLATPASGGVAKTFSGLVIVNDNTTLVIDHDDSLGAAANAIRLGSGTGTSILRVQSGIASVSLGVSRNLIMRGDSNQIISVPLGSELVVNGVISSSGTNAGGRSLTKTDNGMLVLANQNT